MFRKKDEEIPNVLTCSDQGGNSLWHVSSTSWEQESLSAGEVEEERCTARTYSNGCHRALDGSSSAITDGASGHWMGDLLFWRM